MNIKNKNFGVTLYNARMEKNLSSNEVAEMIGVEFSTYRKYESGAIDLKNCSLVRICKICSVLDLTIEELIGADYVGNTPQHRDVKRLTDLYCSIQSDRVKEVIFKVIIVMSSLS